MPDDLDLDNPDNQIIATAISLQKQNKDTSVIVVSRDINMRVIANSIGLFSEDFEPKSVVKDSEKLYSGFADIVVDDQLVDQFYNG